MSNRKQDTEGQPVDSHVDVIVIGGGAAGASAALQLGRIGRSVAVIDSGRPRNAPAEHMHGFIGFDGTPPSDFLNRARQDLAGYEVAVIDDRVADLVGDRSTGFAATTDTGHTVTARRVVLATGLTDELPDIPGAQERWGRTVIHCPWCHGWEQRGRRIAVMDNGVGHHQALLMAQLSDSVTFYTNSRSASPLTDEQRDELGLVGAAVDDRAITGLGGGEGPIQIQLSDGASVEADVVVVAPRLRPNSAVVSALQPEMAEHPMGIGSMVVVSENGETTTSGLYAAGNVADPMQQVLHAAADGSRVAVAVNHDLLLEDIEQARRSVSDGEEWDDRYGDHDGQMWRSTPNGSLVVEVQEMKPGRVLDVGCGEGADAIWLAEQGWQVTAVDISAVAVDRARDAAAGTGTDVDFQARDVITEPLPQRSFDLVTISYPAIRQPDGSAAIRALAATIAPGGELLIIGHAHDPDGEHGFDPADYVSIDDVSELLGADFGVTLDQTRDRPNPPEGAHHTADRIFRIRSRPEHTLSSP